MMFSIESPEFLEISVTCFLYGCQVIIMILICIHGDHDDEDDDDLFINIITIIIFVL